MKAVKSVIQSARSAAKHYDVKRNILMRFTSIAKVKDQKETATMGYKTPGQSFSIEQEKEMNKYLLDFFRIAPRVVHRILYDYAVEHKLKMPDIRIRITNKMAGKDWMTAFLKRNPHLSIRKPEANQSWQSNIF